MLYGVGCKLVKYDAKSKGALGIDMALIAVSIFFTR